MSVLIRGIKMPKECGECRWFYFYGETCTTPKYYLDARCELVKSGQDWYGKDSRGGWIGKSISHLPGYGDRYTDEHCVEIGSRASDCPLVEVPEPHGRLIDAEKLKNEYPHDTDWDYPVNTNSYVCESIDNASTVIEAEGE